MYILTINIFNIPLTKHALSFVPFKIFFVPYSANSPRSRKMLQRCNYFKQTQSPQKNTQTNEIKDFISIP